MTAVTSRGFTFIELVVSIAIMLAVTASMFGFVNSARSAFATDLERADMQQRVRLSMDSLFRDLVMAGAGGQMPAVAPFRRGEINADLPGAAFSDRVSVRYVPPDKTSEETETITYALVSSGSGVPKLTKYDGRVTELPVVDEVADLRFDYFDASGLPIPLARFADGPWVPDGVSPDRYDADLRQIRRVRARVRVRPARMFAGLRLPDLDAVIDVAPRNLNLQ
jgi:prepilin-type N-terminal cleavage/methylation domain-containing protein